MNKQKISNHLEKRFEALTEGRKVLERIDKIRVGKTYKYRNRFKRKVMKIAIAKNGSLVILARNMEQNINTLMVVPNGNSKLVGYDKMENM